MSSPRSIAVFTRRNPAQTAEPLRRVVQRAGAAGIEVRVPQAEIDKHGLAGEDGIERLEDHDDATDLALALGGDGTILTTLRRYAGREVPVFAVNYGAIGFLSTVEAADFDSGVERAFTGDFEVLGLPALTAATGAGDQLAVNDISFHRRQEGRVAELAYSVSGEELGQVRCDGLVVSTAAGSTGYNLANAGPVLAWGVAGYVVSFIAPHTLTARALVVAPSDIMEVTNGSTEEPVDMTTDGRHVCAVEPGETVTVRFGERRALLAQLPGATFYRRLRDKFGRLAY